MLRYLLTENLKIDFKAGSKPVLITLYQSFQIVSNSGDYAPSRSCFCELRRDKTMLRYLLTENLKIDFKAGVKPVLITLYQNFQIVSNSGDYTPSRSCF